LRKLHYGTEKDQFCDERDGKAYVKVVIGTGATAQTWMAESLNYETTNSKCYANSEANCNIYGRLYNWEEAKVGCPSGWHLPSNAEWEVLMATAGGSSIAGKHLKATNGWNDCGPSGSGKTHSCEDTYGFSALPSGFGTSSTYFNALGTAGGLRSIDEYNSSNVYYLDIYNNGNGMPWMNGNKTHFFGVRCVKD